MTTIKKENHYNRTYKLIAQTFGMTVCLITLFYLAGNVVPELSKEKDDFSMSLIKSALLVIPMIGFLLTWYHEKAGAVILIAGGLVLILFGLLKDDIIMSLSFGVAFIAIGALFLYHLKKRDELKRKNK